MVQCDGCDCFYCESCYGIPGMSSGDYLCWRARTRRSAAPSSASCAHPNSGEARLRRSKIRTQSQRRSTQGINEIDAHEWDEDTVDEFRPNKEFFCRRHSKRRLLERKRQELLDGEGTTGIDTELARGEKVVPTTVLSSKLVSVMAPRQGGRSKRVVIEVDPAAYELTQEQIKREEEEARSKSSDGDEDDVVMVDAGRSPPPRRLRRKRHSTCGIDGSALFGRCGGGTDSDSSAASSIGHKRLKKLADVVEAALFRAIHPSHRLRRCRSQAPRRSPRSATAATPFSQAPPANHKLPSSARRPHGGVNARPTLLSDQLSARAIAALAVPNEEDAQFLLHESRSSTYRPAAGYRSGKKEKSIALGFRHAAGLAHSASARPVAPSHIGPVTGGQLSSMHAHHLSQILSLFTSSNVGLLGVGLKPEWDAPGGAAGACMQRRWRHRRRRHQPRHERAGEHEAGRHPEAAPRSS